jgi:threonylcarbamoyladenosine tRNA methylthiotransferase MtaB
MIRRAARLSARVVVTGCYAQMNPDVIAGMDGVVSVVPNAKKSAIVGQLALDAGRGFGMLNPCEGSRSRYFLKIQDGCDRACTYCLVWKARGNPRSVEPERVVEHARAAIEHGYSEIVLTGVHLGLYGVDLRGKINLASLLDQLLTQTRGARFRLSSLEVNELDGKMIDLMADPRVCDHLHLPLQSGDDGVLARMNRRYTAYNYAHTIERIASRLPGIGLGTDVIAGFPGEDDAAHANTVALVKSLPFTYIHVFPYSARSGTAAERIRPCVPVDLRKKRASEIRELSDLVKNAYISSQIGEVHEVLVEKSSASMIVQGITSNYLRAVVQGSKAQPGLYSGSIRPGRLVFMRVLRAESGQVIGIPAPNAGSA